MPPGFSEEQKALFRELAFEVVEIAQKRCPIGEVHKNVTEIRTLLTGNGRPQDGLLIRVQRLEEDRTKQRSALKVWSERAWRILCPVIVAIIVAYLVVHT